MEQETKAQEETLGQEVKRVEPQANPTQTIIIQQAEAKPRNGAGTAGFVLALIGFFFSWVPYLGWIVWVLGLIFSFVGVFRQPRGLAIAGLIISCISLIVLIAVVGAIATAFMV